MHSQSSGEAQCQLTETVHGGDLVTIKQPQSLCGSQDHTQEQEEDVLAPNVLWCQWTEVIGRSGVV